MHDHHLLPCVFRYEEEAEPGFASLRQTYYMHFD